MSALRDPMNITAAATRLAVSLDKMREWADAGNSDGFPIDVWRDPKTNVRYFSKAQIESLVSRRASRFVLERSGSRT